MIGQVGVYADRILICIQFIFLYRTLFISSQYDVLVIPNLLPNIVSVKRILMY